MRYPDGNSIIQAKIMRSLAMEDTILANISDFRSYEANLAFRIGLMRMDIA